MEGKDNCNFGFMLTSHFNPEFRNPSKITQVDPGLRMTLG